MGVSEHDVTVARRPDGPLRASNGLSRAVRRQVATKNIFDLGLECLCLFVFGETDTHPLGAVASGFGRRDPGHLAGNRVTLGVVGQRDQYICLLYTSRCV